MITKEQVADLKNKSDALHKAWCIAHSEHRNAEREYKNNLQKVCKHLKTKIVDRSWHEPPMRETAYWKEKVCCVCDKVLAQTTTKEVWTDR